MIDQHPKDAFHSNFRMGREVFKYLVKELSTVLRREDTQLKNAIPVEKRIVIGLKVLATNMEMVNVGQLFGVGTTSVWKCFHDFIESVNQILKQKHLKMPSSEKFRQIALKFERKYNFPMTVGAIDGCHVPISVPKDQASELILFCIVSIVINQTQCHSMFSFECIFQFFFKIIKCN